MKAILAPGVEILCPHCGEWHTLAPSDSESTTTIGMLFFMCKGRRFYAGHTDEWGHGYQTRGAFKYTGLGCPKCRQPIADVEGEPFAGTLVFAARAGIGGTPTRPAQSRSEAIV